MHSDLLILEKSAMQTFNLFLESITVPLQSSILRTMFSTVLQTLQLERLKCVSRIKCRFLYGFITSRLNSLVKFEV